jgi:hypothetical protein
MTDTEPIAPAREQRADLVIAHCGGDPRAAVIELLPILESLIAEEWKLRASASPGFARTRPIVFGSSK